MIALMGEGHFIKGDSRDGEQAGGLRTWTTVEVHECQDARASGPACISSNHD